MEHSSEKAYIEKPIKGKDMAKKNVRFMVALSIGKMAKLVQRMLGMNATYFPGRIAIKLCPDFLGRIDKPETIIAVTGTNGKTTVCNLIIDILSENGFDLMNNRAGSNTNAGIGTALLSQSTFFGKAKKKWGVLEIDERSSKLIYPYVCPTYVICTNLFRDSIQRNAHAEFIADIITSSMPRETKLILNADDSISSRLAPDNERLYFGISEMSTDHKECTNIINDCQICPICSSRLKFNYVRYHHIGSVFCPNCDYASPKANYLAHVSIEAGTMILDQKGVEEEYKLISNSVFNIYNQVTAITILAELGLTKDQIVKGFEKNTIVETRYSHSEWGGVEVITHLAKGHNPIANSCVFDYITQIEGKKEVILMQDDDLNHQTSSENMTWIYDADFEKLNTEDISRIIIGGVRAEDYKLRLLIAGIHENKIFSTKNELDTPELLLLDHTEKIFILHQVYKTVAAKKAKENIIDILKGREDKKDEN